MCRSVHVNSSQGLTGWKKNILPAKKRFSATFVLFLSPEFLAKAAARTEALLNCLVTARPAVAPYFLLFTLLPLQAVQHVAVASHSQIAQSYRADLDHRWNIENNLILAATHTLPSHRWWHLSASLFAAVDMCPSCEDADKSSNINWTFAKRKRNTQPSPRTTLSVGDPPDLTYCGMNLFLSVTCPTAKPPQRLSLTQNHRNIPFGFGQALESLSHRRASWRVHCYVVSSLSFRIAIKLERIKVYCWICKQLLSSPVWDCLWKSKTQHTHTHTVRAHEWLFGLRIVSGNGSILRLVILLMTVEPWSYWRASPVGVPPSIIGFHVCRHPKLEAIENPGRHLHACHLSTSPPLPSLF